MTPNQFYQANTKERVEEVAKGAGTTFGNFQQIAIANGSVSKKLASKLADSSNQEMTVLEILFPEQYEEKDQDCA